MREISLDYAIEEFIDFKLAQMYIALPCRVVAVRVDLRDQRVDVQPLTNKKLPDLTFKEQNTILNVPLVFPASKKAAVTFPVDIGDTVLCVFSQRSLDGFKAAKGPDTYTPNDNRRFNINDAVAFPGLFPFMQSINEPVRRKWVHSTKDVVVANNIGTPYENEFRLKSNGDISIQTSQDFYMTFNDGLIECNNLVISCSGNYTVDAGGAISITSGEDTTMVSNANTNINVTGDLAIQAANWNVSVAGTTVVNCPTTNWFGLFNLAGGFAMSGGGGGGTATIDAPLTVNNSVNVVGGDVTADGVGLKSHTHTDPQGGTVGPATG